MDILVIPDPHAHPNYDNDRFTALGHYIVEKQPDTIICLGDLADMPSLSTYDMFKRSGEGRRYQDDIAATIDAQEKLFAPLREYNKGRRKKYQPRTIITLGNHEDRINRATNDAPHLYGKLSIRDLKYHEYWDKVVPYQVIYRLAGIEFCHFFPSGVNGKPISGKYLAAAILNKQHCSAIQGHTHRLDSFRLDPSGKNYYCASAGCYSHPKQVEGWNRATVKEWWYGVLLLKNVRAGKVKTIHEVEQSDIMRDYL